MLLHRIVVEYNKVTVNKFSEVLLYKNKYKPPISYIIVAHGGFFYTKLIFTCLSKANAILQRVLILVFAPCSILAIVD